MAALWPCTLRKLTRLVANPTPPIQRPQGQVFCGACKTAADSRAADKQIRRCLLTAGAAPQIQFSTTATAVAAKEWERVMRNPDWVDMQAIVATVAMGPDCMRDFLMCKTGDDLREFRVKWYGHENMTVREACGIALEKMGK